MALVGAFGLIEDQRERIVESKVMLNTSRNIILCLGYYFLGSCALGI